MSTKKQTWELDTERLAVFVDPGDVHVGVSVWEHRPEGWTCGMAQEMGVHEFQDWFAGGIQNGMFGFVLFETWQLYGDKALEQTGSEMETSQLIGVIKYIVRTANKTWPDSGEVQIHQQGASIKKATRAILRAKKVKSVAKALKLDPDGHGFDAEMHGYQFFGSNGLPLNYLTKIE